MEVLVVGAGSMGRWVADLLVTALSTGEFDSTPTVSFYDENTTVAEQAATETDGQAVASLSESPDEFYDVVAVAVPIPAATDAIAEHTPHARRAIFDVTGVMAGPVDALESQTTDQEWASVHPLFAPENEPGNVPVVTGTSGEILAAVWETLEQRGNTVFETTPTEHDEMMETVQARAHATILAYGLAGESVPERFQTAVSKHLDALVAQVAGGDPRVYADIQTAFDGTEDIATMAQRLADANRDEFDALYREIPPQDTHSPPEDNT
jgi:prephenate dehydrogenase